MRNELIACYTHCIFPTGKGGISAKNESGKNNKKISFNQYYRYMTSIRIPNALQFDSVRDAYMKENFYDETFKGKKSPIGALEWSRDRNIDLSDFSPMRLGGKLYQHYLVNSYVKTEQDRLDYLRYNQPVLKAEKYKVLTDHIKTTDDKNGENVGKSFILPSSFKGSPRSCQQGYQDSMSLVRRFGKPDLFITFTCNPNWPEIQRNLQPGNTAMDEPDLVNRVFHMQLKEFMNDIVKNEIYGKVLSYTYVIEFQKRGLPHAHILIILDKDCKIREIDDIDNIVCAEIPDKEKFPNLYEIVTRHMIHGPCGEHNLNCPCMEEKRDENGVMKKVCSKGFPKEFKEKSEIGNDSYAMYRRRDNGVEFEKNGVKIDNRWVVPYNKYLCLRYNAHINVEICASVKAVKYLYKYVYKGHDCAKMVISIDGKEETVYDEIKKFVDMRYVTPHEAYWRIAEFELDKKSHSVTRLDLHLPDEQIVYYKPGEDLTVKLPKAEKKNTTLTAWFELNKKNPEARKYFYYEIPEHFTFKEDDELKKKRLEDNKKNKQDGHKGKKNPERAVVQMIWGKKGGEKGKYYETLHWENVHCEFKSRRIVLFENVAFACERSTKLERSIDS